jgi:lipoate-protein ligase A
MLLGLNLDGILKVKLMETWRYLPLSVNNPAMNMAIDEAILTARVSEKVPNTLRLYRWQPSAVSIGRNQTLEDWVYLENCKRLGVEVVRRCSGGGAVYHDSEGEVTYNAVANVASLGNTADITAVYQKIYGAVTDALRLLGVPADFNGGDAKNCPNLTVGGKKISGSSQNLTRGYVLQHGTLLRSVDIDKMFQLLKLKDASCSQAADIARDKITSVEGELCHKMSPDTLANALAQGFKAILKIQLQEGSLTPYELELAEILYEDKYATKEWTLTGKTV